MAKVKSYYKPRKKRSSTARTRGKAISRSLGKKLRVLVLGVLSVLIGTLVFVGVGIYQFANAPFSSAGNVDLSDTAAVWQSDSTNILLIKLKDRDDKYSEIERLSLVNFDNVDNRYSIYHIPVNEEIEYALNYGTGTLSRIYSVGNLDQDRGVFLLRSTILRQLAISTHGYIIVDENGLNRITEVIGEIDQRDLSASLRLKKLVKVPELVATFRETTVTNLKISDVLSVLNFIRGTSESSSQVRSLTRYQLLDGALWDQLWQSRQNFTEVRKEGIKVFIANASHEPRVPGLAGWGARVAQNLGVSVLETDNAFVEFAENTIITDDYELLTVKELAEALDIETIIHVDNLNSHYSYNPQIFRTNVSLILVN